MASYVTIAEFLDRKDYRTVADLASDDPDGTVKTKGQLIAGDAVLQAALDSASGAIDAACQQGGRYSTADLTALTGNSGSYLKHLTTEIAMAYLFARKPTYSAEAYRRTLEAHDLYLERLRKGENVFNIANNIDAGVPDYVAPLAASIENLQLIRDRTKAFYPARRDQRLSG